MKGKLPSLGYTPTLEFEDTNRDRDFWVSRPDLNEETRQSLRAADILIVPEGDDYQGEGIYFPEGTIEFYHYLLAENAAVEVAANDDDFKEVARHFDLVILGGFVVTSVVLPLFVNLLSKHLENRLLNPEKSAIRIALTVQNSDGSAKHLNYEGPVNEFESQIKPLFQEVLEESPSSLPSASPPALPSALENEDQAL